MARNDAFVDTLATVPLFSACSKKELQMVAKAADHVTMAPGQVVVTEGAAGTEFFVILDGRARVERHGKEVASLAAGSFFGDLALLDRAPRNASVVADSELELAKIGQRAFDELLDHPGFSKKLLAGLARRLREQDARNY
jgi:CRP/FNR family cyclic AMP-dependent transcriptional regulator